MKSRIVSITLAIALVITMMGSTTALAASALSTAEVGNIALQGGDIPNITDLLPGDSYGTAITFLANRHCLDSLIDDEGRFFPEKIILRGELINVVDCLFGINRTAEVIEGWAEPATTAWMGNFLSQTFRSLGDKSGFAWLPVESEVSRRAACGYIYGCVSASDYLSSLLKPSGDVYIQDTSIRFEDVPAGHYAEEAIRWAVKREITVGTTATTFTPDRECTVAEALVFVWRAAGKPKATAKVALNGPDFASDALNWAVAKGVVDSTEDFSRTCKRDDMVIFLWKVAGRPESNAAVAFGDVTAGSALYHAVSWAVENGVTNGAAENRFAPEASITRAQVATFIYRAFARPTYPSVSPVR